MRPRACGVALNWNKNWAFCLYPEGIATRLGTLKPFGRCHIENPKHRMKLPDQAPQAPRADRQVAELQFRAVAMIALTAPDPMMAETACGLPAKQGNGTRAA